MPDMEGRNIKKVSSNKTWTFFPNRTILPFLTKVKFSGSIPSLAPPKSQQIRLDDDAELIQAPSLSITTSKRALFFVLYPPNLVWGGICSTRGTELLLNSVGRSSFFPWGRHDRKARTLQPDSIQRERHGKLQRIVLTLPRSSRECTQLLQEI